MSLASVRGRRQPLPSGHPFGSGCFRLIALVRRAVGQPPCKHAAKRSAEMRCLRRVMRTPSQEGYSAEVAELIVIAADAITH